MTPSGQQADNDAVSPVELLFDLVFIFAMTQLSAHLLDDHSWRGAAETAVLIVAVFNVWAYSTFDATLVRVRGARARSMLLTVMLLGLFMNASITRAFGSEPWAFVLPFLLIQAGRPIWTIIKAPTSLLREHYVRVLAWILAVSPLWIAGAFAEPDSRLLWWALAAAIDQLGTSFAHPVPGRKLDSENADFDASHLLERCRLFLIIALGEAVLTTGVAISGVDVTPMAVLTGTCALITIVALWALYFGGSDHLLNEHVESTSDPILAGRMTIGSEVIVVAALIVLAVGNEMVITHPYGDTAVALTLMLFGGPIVYLLVQSAILKKVNNAYSRARIAGVGVLGVGAAFSTLMSPFASLLLVAAILVGLVAAAAQGTWVPPAEPQ